MTRTISAGSADVVNGATSVQSRIDTVLAAPVMEWDHSPEIGWQPGDPLYPHPWSTPLSSDVQYVRRMVEEIDEARSHHIITEHSEEYGDYRVLWRARCSTCQVSWNGPEACWVCGDPDTAWPVLAPGSITFDEAFAVDWQRTMAEWSRLWDSVRDRQMAAYTCVVTPRRSGRSALEALVRPALEALVRAAQEPEPEPEPQSWIRANATVRLLPAITDPAAPTVAEIEAARPVDAFIQIPAGAEITAVQGPPPAPRVEPPRGYGGRWPEIRRYYFNRPVTESRRPRETR